jgi:hypothetical protein
LGESLQTTQFLTATKEVIDTVTGKRDGQIAELPAGASNDQIIAKINELLNRIQ